MKFKFSEILFLIVLQFCFIKAKDLGTPQNIIILIGDGMGINYVSASILSIDNSPYKSFSSVGFSVTCSADKLITDSAAGATAIATGYRTNNYSVSVDTSGKPLKTLFERAEEFGYSTGIVVTSTVTHATPAAFLSHVKHRKDENEIALQYLEQSVDVVIGGGRKFFNQDILKNIKSNYNFYSDYSSLAENPAEKNFYALLDEEGLPSASKRNYTLGELTKTALENLNKRNNGFILMVEGSQIDWAAHDNLTDKTLAELKDFNSAINEALLFAEKEKNTLILVTADHETGGMAITGGTLQGDSLKMNFTTGGHSAEMVGVFAKGPGEELFRGVYDNFMIGRNLFYLIDKSYHFSNN